MSWLRDAVGWTWAKVTAPVRWVKGKAQRGGKRLVRAAGREFTGAALAKTKDSAGPAVEAITRTAVRTAADELQHVAPQLIDSLATELARSIEARVRENRDKVEAAVEDVHTQIQYLVSRTLLRLLLVALHAYLLFLLVPASHAMATSSSHVTQVQAFAVVLAIIELVLAFAISIALPVLKVPPPVAPQHGAALSLLVFVGMALFLSWSSITGLWHVGDTRPAAPWAVSPLIPASFAVYGIGVLVLTVLAVVHRKRHRASPDFLRTAKVIDFLRSWVAPSRGASPATPQSR